MDMFAKTKITTLYLLLVLSLGVIIAGGNSIIIFDSLAVSSKSKELVEKQIPILKKAHEMKLSVVQIQQWLTDISATRGLDGLNDGFNEAENNARRFNSLINELIGLDSEHAARYQAMLPNFEAYYAMGKTMAQAYVDHGPDGGNKIMGKFDEVAAKIGDDVNTVVEKIEKEVDLALEAQEAEAASTRSAGIMGTIVLLLGLVASYFIMSRVLAVLPGLVTELQRVSEGDLSSPIEVNRKDEIGELMFGLQAMQHQLRNVVSKIDETTNNLAASSGDLVELSGQTSDRIMRQKIDTEQMATAMSQMSATVNEVSNSITTTSNSATKARNETENGSMVVKEAIQGIQQLSVQIQGAANVISELGQDSKNINAVLDVIKGIAEQTNLLALNAAIEAARAGEQGRGFAVVADEVRTLAGRTQESTTEINQMIEKLQTGSRSAVQAMHQSQEQVNAVVAKAEQAGLSLQAIMEAVAEIDNKSYQIAVAAKEQSVVAEEMNRNIVRINKMASQNADSAEETSRSGQGLKTVASELQQLVNQFRL